MKMRHDLMGMVATAMACALLLTFSSPLAAKKGNGGPSSDSPDPDYAISAVAHEEIWSPAVGELLETPYCFAANPDQKGPGIAYHAFFPEGCVSLMTSNGVELSDPINIFMWNDGGDIVELEFRGRALDDNGDETLNIGYDSMFFTPPAGENFIIHVHEDIQLLGCSGKGNKQVCDSIGYIAIADLKYDLPP